MSALQGTLTRISEHGERIIGDPLGNLASALNFRSGQHSFPQRACAAFASGPIPSAAATTEKHLWR
jgi:hypothetical protein